MEKIISKLVLDRNGLLKTLITMKDLPKEIQ